MGPVSVFEPNPLRPIRDERVNTCLGVAVWFTGPVRAVVLSDTHLRDGGTRRLPDPVYTALREAHVVLHCGDVVERGLLDELATFAPVHAVLGNNDASLRGVLPERLLVELAGVRVGMVHDSGLTKGRPARVRRMFPDCDIVLFGHSHAPVDEEGVDGQRLFNPGSPTQRRMQPHPSFGVLDLDAGAIVGHRVVTLSR
jgi:putative phosphoesterase